MKIINPSIDFITPLNQRDILRRLEICGRTCYKSEEKMVEGSDMAFVSMLIRNGHESVLEHCSLTIQFTIDRGVSHELVRHRLASYSQESTRYCNYSKGKFGGEITVIQPCYLDPNSIQYELWKRSCEAAEDAYMALLESGLTPQEARAVLPMSLKTEVVMTANLREWRTVLKQRLSPAAHPQIREVMQMVLDALKKELPVIFGDLSNESIGCNK